MTPQATHPLHAALARATTAEILWALGEILEPSQNGPFHNSYGGDDDAITDAFMDALCPVTQAYREAYRGLDNILSDDRPISTELRAGRYADALIDERIGK